nr:MAG TPA: hypothetical protein [Caudoviricetes sp.]DAQ13099.1 MAG TPA: hypothetical protein [Bacteriophage sp.]DAR45920.1 MAG TPA: hypothetical protein [Caudoviricetes sp.]
MPALPNERWTHWQIIPSPATPGLTPAALPRASAP